MLLIKPSILGIQGEKSELARSSRGWVLEQNSSSDRFRSVIDFECWQRACELARFFHEGEELPTRIAVLAVSRLESASRRQGQRWRYRPKVRRRKVTMDHAQLLQRLVLKESERWERLEEEGNGQPPDDRTLLVRYVKHLVQISVVRNLLHVTIAICRLLYRYSTRETLTIYDRLSLDEGCPPDDSYLRARRKILLGEMRQRFGRRLELGRGARGELLFRATPANQRQHALVERALGRLKPWRTPCPASPRATEGQQRPEMVQIHRLIHPPCFAGLIRELGLPEPGRRLYVPSFRPA